LNLNDFRPPVVYCTLHWVACVAAISLAVLLLPAPSRDGNFVAPTLLEASGGASQNGSATATAATSSPIEVACARFTLYDRDDGFDGARAACELTALVFQAVLFVLHVIDVAEYRRNHGRQLSCCKAKLKAKLPTLTSLVMMLPHAGVGGVRTRLMNTPL
jgi:hypothetical protein